MFRSLFSLSEPLQAKDEYRDEEVLKPIVDGGSQITRSKVMVCYMVAWSAGRQGAGKFSVSNADTEHCTHIIYAFMTIDKTTNKISSVDEVFDHVELPKLKELKRTNRAVKVLASIGGWGQGSERFSKMAESPEKRRIFINSVLEFIKKYELDGIDMCWQFPTQRGGKQEDKQNSLTLLKINFPDESVRIEQFGTGGFHFEGGRNRPLMVSDFDETNIF